jgi:hypothetical protein
MHKKNDMYKIYLRTPDDGNLLGETYVGVVKYVLSMSIFLCICWLILDF